MYGTHPNYRFATRNGRFTTVQSATNPFKSYGYGSLTDYAELDITDQAKATATNLAIDRTSQPVGELGMVATKVIVFGECTSL